MIYRKVIFFITIALICIGLSSLSYQSLASELNEKTYLILGAAFVGMTYLFLTDKRRALKERNYYLYLLIVLSCSFFIVASLINNLAPNRSILNWLKLIPPLLLIVTILIFKKDKLKRE